MVAKPRSTPERIGETVAEILAVVGLVGIDRFLVALDQSGASQTVVNIGAGQVKPPNRWNTRCKITTNTKPVPGHARNLPTGKAQDHPREAPRSTPGAAPDTPHRSLIKPTALALLVDDGNNS